MSHKTGEMRTCHQCGNEFYIPAAWLRKSSGAGTYCSLACKQKFYQSDGLTSYQRWYRKHQEERLASARQYYKANRDKETERHRRYVAANQEHMSVYTKEREGRPEVRARRQVQEQTSERKRKRKEYREKNPRTAYYQKHESAYKEKRKELHSIHQASDPQYRLRRALRGRLKQAMLRNYKTGSAIDLLGCSISELRVHLENQWLPGMSWANFGRLGNAQTWQIDHIKPLSKFDLTSLADVKIACHWTNLQPLWALDNRRKWNKTEAELGVQK